MKTKLFAIPILLFCSCVSDQGENCRGKILDLELKSFNDSPNKIIEYSESTDFKTIQDSSELIKYEPVDRIQHFFQSSKLDSTKRKYTIKVKPGVIKTAVYDVDIILIKDNDATGENVFYSLNSYDKNRNLVGHLDLAQWSQARNSLVSGRIDCDSSLHIILNDRKEHRIFRADEKGEIHLVSKQIIE